MSSPRPKNDEALRQIEEAEARARARTKAHGLDFHGRELNPLEVVARDFVIAQAERGALRKGTPIVMVGAFGPPLDTYHETLEKDYGDGPHGTMVEVRNHWLPESVQTAYPDLLVVTVTFTPSEKFLI